QMQLRGKLHLDDGAVKVLRGSGKSLLPVGVKRVDGDFDRGDLVACVDPQGHEVARGLVNYAAADARKIAGVKSAAVAACLGYPGEPEMIHRDNLVVSS
ncbi:MAG: PUA domain-containing protein, partial [Stenotrophobium sp.]